MLPRGAISLGTLMIVASPMVTSLPAKETKVQGRYHVTPGARCRWAQGGGAATAIDNGAARVRRRAATQKPAPRGSARQASAPQTASPPQRS